MKKKDLFIICILSLFIIVLMVIFYFFYGEKEVPSSLDNPVIEDEEKIEDDTVPLISVKKEILQMDDSFYNLEDNIEFQFGPLGGVISCSGDKGVGENTITCIAKGNNTLESSISYTLIRTTTYQKNVIFFGDSIVQGWGSKNRHYSWANYIGEHYDLASSINAGITDYRLSTYDDPKKWLVQEVMNHYNDSTIYDMVILEGGINDLFYETPLGEIAVENGEYDDDTFTGGLEHYLASVKDKWNDAKIGYILTYYTPNCKELGKTYSFETYKKYYDRTIEVLEKWNIPYLDLFLGKTEEGISYRQLLQVEKKTYLPDYLHLNDAGYYLISPYIYEWMQTL